MNTSIIIGALILGLIILIFIWIHNKQAKKQNQKLEVLYQLALSEGYTITEKEILMNNIIGIDGESKMLFFINSEKNMKEILDLSKFKKCNVQERSRTSDSNSGSQKVVEKIELSFIPFSSNSSNVILEIYNIDNGDFYLNGEFQFCEKWTLTINKLLQK